MRELPAQHGLQRVALYLHPQYAFMACFLVKHSGNFTFTFTTTYYQEYTLFQWRSLSCLARTDPEVIRTPASSTSSRTTKVADFTWNVLLS
jgi:hypothetical protein